MTRRWAFLRVVFGRHEIEARSNIIMENSVKAWWKDALERLLWTFAQGAIAILTVNQLGWIELADGELWKAAAGGGIGSAFSFLKSLIATKVSEDGTAQLGTTTYSYTEAGPGSAGGDL